MSYSNEEIVEGAIAWFRTLGSWPEEKPTQMIQRIHQHSQGPARDGVHGMLLMLAMANGDEWPPTMSPVGFAKAIETSKKLQSELLRFAGNCRVVDGQRREEMH